MSKKGKKNKVKKLTETEYANYIMALKDEVPPMIIREQNPGESEEGNS